MLVYAIDISVHRLDGRSAVAPTADPAGSGILEPGLCGHGFSRSFVQLVLLRGAEGLGESFYFPASMSMLVGLPWTANSLPRDEHSSDQRISGNGRRLVPWGYARSALRLAVAVLGLGAGGHGICPDAWVLAGRAEPHRVAMHKPMQPSQPVMTSEIRFRRRFWSPAREGRANRDQSRCRRALGCIRGGQLRRDDVPELVTDVCVEKIPSQSERLGPHLDVVATGQSAGALDWRRAGRPGRADAGEEAGSACKVWD